ncbi:hypothetical protein pb186bvf_015128 [Paramecium bursaria]
MKIFVLVFILGLTIAQEQQDNIQIFTPVEQQEVFTNEDLPAMSGVGLLNMINSIIMNIEQQEREDAPTFLALDQDIESQQSQLPLQEDDQSDISPIGTLFGSFMNLLPFDMGSNNGESVEIETIVMNGETQRRVTKTSMKNGVKTITTSITKSGSASNILQAPELSPSFKIEEATTLDQVIEPVEAEELPRVIDIPQEEISMVEANTDFKEVAPEEPEKKGVLSKILGFFGMNN